VIFLGKSVLCVLGFVPEALGTEHTEIHRRELLFLQILTPRELLEEALRSKSNSASNFYNVVLYMLWDVW